MRPTRRKSGMPGRDFVERIRRRIDANLARSEAGGADEHAPVSVDDEAVDHEWLAPGERLRWASCAKCGAIRRADGRQGACRGWVEIALRQLDVTKEDPE